MKSNLRFVIYGFVVGATCILFVVIICFCLGIPTINNTMTSSQVSEPYDIMTEPTMLGNINISRKYAVFSTTSAKTSQSLGFVFLLPLTALAWKRIGFDSVVIIVGSMNVWNSDPLLHTVLTSLRQLDAVVIFINAHPTNSVMVSQVRNTFVFVLFFFREITI